MIELGAGLMLASPVRPGEAIRCAVLHRQHQMPEQVANLGDTQPDASPRCALNAVNLLRLCPACRPLFGRSASIDAARTTVKNAWKGQKTSA